VGNNDAWRGYGGAVVYTRDAKLPESLKPRLREAAKKIHNWDFDKDFVITDNTCKVLDQGEVVKLREQFAGKVAIQTEQQLQAQATMAARMAGSTIKTDEDLALKAIGDLEKQAEQFEKSIEKEIVKDVTAIEEEIVKDVISVEKEIVKDVSGIFQKK
jgi:violaxanthin de-epoxidase